MQTAQKEAAIPIKATMLLPSNKWSKSSSVILKIIKASAITTKTVVKIFMGILIWSESNKNQLNEQTFNVRCK